MTRPFLTQSRTGIREGAIPFAICKSYASVTAGGAEGKSMNARSTDTVIRWLLDGDPMLFPNLLSANLTVKAIMYTAACRFGGVLCGAACPVVFMSRVDTATTRLNSLALALHSQFCGC
jgi:hypothetical protein